MKNTGYFLILFCFAASPPLTEDFVTKMKVAGAPVEYLKIDGVGHAVAYNEKLSITDPAMKAFFAKHLKPGK